MNEATTPSNDRRAILEASFEEAEGEVSSSPTPESYEAPETAPEGYSEPPESNPTEEAEPQAPARDYSRDEQGKFALKKAADAQKQQKSLEQAQKTGVQPGPKGPQAPTREWSAEKAPQAWKPEAREFWKDLPEPVRREVVRHAQAANEAIDKNLEARRFSDAVMKTVAPYQHFIKAEGSNPIQAIDNMMSAAALLRTGTSDQIAGLVAQITNQFGIGRFGNDFVNKLDGALAGNVPAPVNPEMAAMKQQFDQEIAPLRQMQQQMQQQQQMAYQQQEASAQGELQAFAQQAEFLGDVRHEMADIIDMGAQRGVTYSLQQAYDIACRANPDIARVIQQRDQNSMAQRMNQTTQRAKQAAVGVGGAPSMSGSDQKPSNLRSAIELAISRSTR